MTTALRGSWMVRAWVFLLALVAPVGCADEQPRDIDATTQALDIERPEDFDKWSDDCKKRWMQLEEELKKRDAAEKALEEATKARAAAKTACDQASEDLKVLETELAEI
ncbi:MAG: hypothetical protein HY698_06880, partial [Deltaproteobacteria bacterium]|nr:hypothetical protein [Deltaproteobacteria bacterium]